MAWTYTNSTVLYTPFVVTKIAVTVSDTTATALDHGGPSNTTPDLVMIAGRTESPTGHEIVWTAKGASTVTFDVQANCAFDAYCFFFNQSRQDGQSINSDNDS